MSAFPEKKRYEDVRFNIISVTRGWVGVKFPGKKRYVTLEWPPQAGDIAGVRGNADIAVIWPATGCMREKWRHHVTRLR